MIIQVNSSIITLVGEKRECDEIENTNICQRLMQGKQFAIEQKRN